MNSESEPDALQELWQKQPAPSARAEIETRVVRLVEFMEAKLKFQMTPDRFLWWLMPPPFLLMVVAGYMVEVETVIWFYWVLTLWLGSSSLTIVLKRWKTLEYERHFESTLLGRIDRGCALLRLEVKFHNTYGLVGGVLWPLILGLQAYEIYHLSTEVSVMVGVGIAVIAVFAGRSWVRGDLRALEQRIAALESARRELAG